MAQLALWNGDICDLEVDAIVSPANVTLWMSTGVAGAIKRRGGDAIEFAAVRQGAGPARRGRSSPTRVRSPRAGSIHAVSLDHQRRTSAAAIEQAARSAVARARELGVETLAIPALGHRRRRLSPGPTRPGSPSPPCATPSPARRACASSPSRCAAPPRTRRSGPPSPRRSPRPRAGRGLTVIPGPSRRDPPDARAARRARRGGRSRDPPPRDDRARPCSSSRRACPTAMLPGSAMTFFDPVLRRLFGGDSAPASAILADELGIEQLIDRLEELDEDLSWDA